MPHNSEFMSAILANPADNYARVRYGEWLQQHGDPRGEFVLLQCRDLDRIVFGDQDKYWRLRGRVLQLEQDHWLAWLKDDLGDVADLTKYIGYTLKPEECDNWDNPPGSGFCCADFTFDRGFVSTLRIHLRPRFVEALREDRVCFDTFQRIVAHPLITQVQYDCDLATGSEVWQRLRSGKPAEPLTQPVA